MILEVEIKVQNLTSVPRLSQFVIVSHRLVVMIFLSCYSDSDLAQHLDQLGCSTYPTWLCKKLRAYAFHGFLLGKCQ